MTTVVSNPANLAGGAVSAVSWPAVFAGGIVAVATSLILLALGSGLGFAAASPWPQAGASATTFAIGAGVWLIIMQWLSSALGGYIAGRLRTKWTGIQTHEVLFRDTAHGLLAWAVASLIVAAVALSATATTINAGANAASVVGYTSDTLLRSDNPRVQSTAREEVGRILSREGPVSATDQTYLTGLVARETGISAPEARRRVEVATTSLRTAADNARKVSSAVGFFTALSMLIGAFIACAAAGYAGHLRDEGELVER
jgi:hypothetical protein